MAIRARDEVYELSGTTPPGALIAGAIGIAASTIVGALYALVEVYVPIAFFVAPFVFAGIVGAIIAIALQRGRLRSPSVGLVIGAVGGACALYAAWVVWLWALTGWGDMPWQPGLVWRLVEAVSRVGAWSLHNVKPTGDALFALWAVEAAIVVGGCAWLTRSQLRELVYCERCGEWARRVLTAELAPRIDDRPLSVVVADEGIAAVARATPRVGDRDAFATLRVDGCAGCNDLHVATVASVVKGKPEKGKDTWKSTDIVRAALVPATFVAALRARLAAPTAAEDDRKEPAAG